MAHHIKHTKATGRLFRIADVLQRELSTLVTRELRDPRLEFITICEVNVSRDLAHAKVFVTFMDDSRIKERIAVLNHAAGFLRTLLAERVVLRTIPQLRFVYDESVAQGNRVASLIEAAIKKENS